MTARFAYDGGRQPPAPVLPIRVSFPGDEPGVLVEALVDSGADVSVIPEVVAADLGLPPVATVEVRGVGGEARAAVLHAAEVETPGGADIVEVLALGEETLLGRNLLNLLLLTLDGPAETLEVAGPA